MIRNPEKYHPFEPWVGAVDYRLPLPKATWNEVDQRASDLLGIECIGVPSVRVGMCWTLEYLGYVRHRDHVLVPQFMGRCILNSLNRHAMPVEAPSSETRLAIVVHQYGLKQRLELIQEECASKGLVYIEDSPYGLETQEELGPGSLAKFIGLTKIMPVLKGALAISRDQSLTRFMEVKRREWSLWSWAALGAMALIRMRHKAVSYSALANAAYEMYPDCKGDNVWLRGNVLRSLQRLHSFAAEARQRVSLIKDRVKERVLIPDTDRIAYAVPYFPNNEVSQSQDVFRLNGFDPNLYHIDVGRNLLCPQFEKALLIPINPRIPFKLFERLTAGLASLSAGRPSTTGPQGSRTSNLQSV